MVGCLPPLSKERRHRWRKQGLQDCSGPEPKLPLGAVSEDGPPSQQPGPPTQPSPSDSTKAAVATPKLVRGLSGVGQTPDSLGALVAAVLPGWSGVDKTTIEVETKSSQGHGSIFKVSAPGVQPPAVALHCWDDDESDTVIIPRTTSAAQLFAKVGLAPARLAHGGDWFVEPWEGMGEPSFEEEGQLIELGRLVAKIHGLSTDWFEPFREQLCERLPALKAVPRASHMWTWTSRDYLLQNLSSECFNAWLRAPFTPSSPLAAQEVTCHADCHAGNMLQTRDAGILLIDFEWACVTNAAQDLSFVVRTCCQEDVSKKKTFMSAYVEARGLQATPEEVDALIFDAEVFFLATHCGGPLELWEAHDDAEDWLQKLQLYAAFVEAARASPSLQQQVIERGIMGYVKELKGLYKPETPIVFSTPPGSALGEKLMLGRDGLIYSEVRPDLVFGAAADGSIMLVPREDKAARAVFLLPVATADSRQRPLAAGGSAALVVQFQLLLASNCSKGVTLAATSSTFAGAVIQPAKLGPAAQALWVSMDAARCLHFSGPRSSPNCGALRVGDPLREQLRREDEDLWEAVAEEDIEGLEALIAKGADINRPREDESLGHVAARAGHLSVLEVLIARGFDVNVRTGGYVGSPLIEAATYGRADCVRRLLAVPGIDLSIKEEGKTALDWARDPAPNAEPEAGHAEAISLLESAVRATLLGRVQQDFGPLVCPGGRPQ